MEMTSYLSFEDKIVLTNTIHRSCFSRYDFTRFNNNIYDIFAFCKDDNDSYDDYCDYMCDIIIEFIDKIKYYYDEYYGYDISHYINDCYNNIYHQRQCELYELFHKTYMNIYARKLAEYIENYRKPMEYYTLSIFEVDEKVDLHDTVIQTIQRAFEQKNINIFCIKCGVFGHRCYSTVTTFAKLRG